MGTFGTIGYQQEPVRNETVAVGISNVTVAEDRNEDAPRKVIVIRNISPNATDIITINFGLSQAVANAGIVLRQYESFTDTQDGGYMPFQGHINAICATATGSLAIMER